jgi:hypothetical protein
MWFMHPPLVLATYLTWGGWSESQEITNTPDALPTDDAPRRQTPRCSRPSRSMRSMPIYRRQRKQKHICLEPKAGEGVN